jgi:hypothetical protein
MRVRSIPASFAAAISLAVTAAVLPATASADASGVQSWGPFTIPGTSISVPGGIMAHTVTGSGARVNAETSNYASAGNICNWRIDYRYSDTSGRTYETNTGPTHLSCNRYGERNIFVGRDMRFGQACAELFTNGRFVVRQCHNITR